MSKPSQIQIYIDESGDKTFNAKGSKYFVLTALVCNGVLPCEIDLLKLLQQIRIDGNELVERFHAAKDSNATRRKFIEIIVEHSNTMQFHCIVVEKRKVFPQCQNTEWLYTKMMSILTSYIFQGLRAKNINSMKVYMDQIQVKEKKRVLHTLIKSAVLEQARPLGIDCQFHHCDTNSMFGLQIADYISWVVYRKWENKLDKWHSCLDKLSVNEFNVFRYGTELSY